VSEKINKFKRHQAKGNDIVSFVVFFCARNVIGQRAGLESTDGKSRFPAHHIPPYRLGLDSLNRIVLLED
jgi:hypothetical protein